MESFILGSEWDLIFLVCYVAQTIKSIFEILIFKKAYLFKILKKSTILFIIFDSHMESFILGSECWKFGLLDMEWPICETKTMNSFVDFFQNFKKPL
jgi:hypothetical protein